VVFIVNNLATKPEIKTYSATKHAHEIRQIYSYMIQTALWTKWQNGNNDACFTAMF